VSSAVNEALRAMSHANPVPDPNALEDAVLRSKVLLKATKETSMSIETNQPTHETPPHKQSKKRRNTLTLVGTFAVVLVVGAAVLLASGDGNDSSPAAVPASSDPAAVVADYLEAWHSEDAEGVVVFYTEDAVIENHPADLDGLATGKSEILGIETQMNRNQGSTGTMEYLNMEVSGDTVTFDNIFINGSGQCFSITGSVLTVEGDKIALVVWGDTPGGLC
jgi:ketosteroid isomerase-like protein